jgi:uncharacterized protein YgiM (DUF1202 family)
MFSRKHPRMVKGTHMRSPKIALFLIIGVLATTTSACSSGQLSEQRVHASTNNTRAQQDSTTATVLVKARKANLRNKPSAYAAVIATVNRGDLLSLTSVKPTGPWYQIRDSTTGAEGWIHGNTIDLLQTATTNPGSTARSTRPRTASTPRPVSTPSSGKSYVNVDGVRVPSPVFSDTKPAGATARCRDGSYSFSQHRRGTCSHHGGVAEWF